MCSSRTRLTLMVLLAATSVCVGMGIGAEDPPQVNLIGSPSLTGSTFLREKDTKRAGVFYNACQNASPPPNVIKENYVLVVSAAGQFAYLFLVLDQGEGPVIANAATLSLGAGRLAVSDTMGGEWTYARFEIVGAQLRLQPFKHTFDYREAIDTPGSGECVLDKPSKGASSAKPNGGK